MQEIPKDISCEIMAYLPNQTLAAFARLNHKFFGDFRSFILNEYKKINPELESYEELLEKIFTLTECLNGFISESKKTWGINLRTLVLERHISFVSTEEFISFLNLSSEEQLKGFVELLKNVRSSPLDQEEIAGWNGVFCSFVRPISISNLYLALKESLLPLPAFSIEKMKTDGPVKWALNAHPNPYYEAPSASFFALNAMIRKFVTWSELEGITQQKEFLSKCESKDVAIDNSDEKQFHSMSNQF